MNKRRSWTVLISYEVVKALYLIFFSGGGNKLISVKVTLQVVKCSYKLIPEELGC